mmetsp:Transcript_4028/g.4157  ORF Transcript_4028/g.4157 Transcript_4028/m.4157 type:complete len:100 (-) Transcript_4028:782-1081(-)
MILQMTVFRTEDTHSSRNWKRGEEKEPVHAVLEKNECHLPIGEEKQEREYANDRGGRTSSFLVPPGDVTATNYPRIQFNPMQSVACYSFPESSDMEQDR